MIIKQLRLVEGCHAMKSSSNITTIESKDGKPGVSIKRMTDGDYIVDFFGELVIVPRGQVKFALPVREPKK